MSLRSVMVKDHPSGMTRRIRLGLGLRLRSYNEFFVGSSSPEGIQGSPVLSPAKYLRCDLLCLLDRVLSGDVGGF